MKSSPAAMCHPSLLYWRVRVFEAASSTGPAGNFINSITASLRLVGDICVGYRKLIFHKHLPLERWGLPNVSSISSRCGIGTSGSRKTGWNYGLEYGNGNCGGSYTVLASRPLACRGESGTGESSRFCLHCSKVLQSSAKADHCFL